MTRLRSEASGSWEFTRFRAEANSVRTIEDARWLADLPEPTQSEYVTKQDSDERVEAIEIDASAPIVLDPPSISATQTPTSFEEVLRFIRNEDYEPAISFLGRYVNIRPEYHVGWLRLGHAQRELAMRKRFQFAEEARTLFDDSIHSLTRATEHTDFGRRGQAFYERSKAFYQRGKFNNDVGDWPRSLADAEEAFSLSPDTSFESWREYVRRHKVDLPGAS